MSLDVSQKVILGAEDVRNLIIELEKKIRSGIEELRKVAIIGIQTRGVVLAKRIKNILDSELNTSMPFGELDITLYRDDLGVKGFKPVVKSTKVEFDVEGLHIILVDDVLYTGRTIRSALDEIVDFGRPASIKLAVLIDRDHRELPIQPDFVAKFIQTKKDEFIRLHLKEVDGIDEVVLIQKGG